MLDVLVIRYIDKTLWHFVTKDTPVIWIADASGNISFSGCCHSSNHVLCRPADPSPPWVHPTPSG